MLDGVCEGYGAYLATPEQLRKILQQDPPDVLAYTHHHPDHYDRLFVSDYLQNTAGPVLGPADIPCADTEPIQLGNVSITPVESRHIGRSDGCHHRSYVLQGSRCVWFLGDASPLHWQKNVDAPKPDVIIAPYGFVLARGWDYCKGVGAKTVVVVHMPLRENDPNNLWEAVDAIPADCSEPQIIVPEIGKTIEV